jgi:hypothetical protein
MVIYEFSGVIQTISLNKRWASIILDQTIEGRRLAVINTDTQGILKLMSSTNSGSLEEGIKVNGHGLLGPDALVATKIYI